MMTADCRCTEDGFLAGEGVGGKLHSFCQVARGLGVVSEKKVEISSFFFKNNYIVRIFVDFCEFW